MSAMVDPSGDKATWKVALEDAVVVFVFSFLSALIATGLAWPPGEQVLYAAFVTAGLAGIIAWARKRLVEIKKDG